MLKNKVDFGRICSIVPNWKWNELRVGLARSIISNNELISYALLILTEDVAQFDSVLNLSIAEEDEVDEMVFHLAAKEEKQDLETINSKWIFSIIYDAYIYLRDNIYDIVEDVYVEFEYPKELSSLISYMPCDDSKPMDERLSEYIQIGKNIWC